MMDLALGLHTEFQGVFPTAVEGKFANLSTPRDAIQPGQIFVKFHAVHHARAGLHFFAGCRCWTARFVRHALLLTRVLYTHLTATSWKFLVACSFSIPVRPSPIVSDTGPYTVRNEDIEIVNMPIVGS